MQIVPLSNHPSAASIVAGWYHAEWGYMHPSITKADIEADLLSSVDSRRLPQLFVAVSDEQVVGAAELKLREVQHLPEYEHWLGGVYVDEHCRGRGIASTLASHVCTVSHREYGIARLYLQTEMSSGGLYKSLGWSEISRFEYGHRERVVMVKEQP